jgi:hypothetical protein
VVVGCQLAFVNHKLQSQLETMKLLIHEYEVSLAAKGMLDCLGFPSPSGSSGIVPVETALPALPMLIPSPRPATIVVFNGMIEYQIRDQGLQLDLMLN